MNWIKRNWYEIGLWLVLAMMAAGLYHDVLTARAQKPEPPKDCPPGWTCGTLKAPEPKAVVTEHPNGDRTYEWTNHDTDTMNHLFFTIHHDGEWEMSPQFWKQIESHCVAVLTEKHTVHHKRTISGGEIPDDRMEWDEEIREQTLRLKCSEK
jgi:hypothetical protein